MTQCLKQSTAVTVKMGPFVSDTDGTTADTTLTIQKADVRLSKNGGNYAAAAADQGGSDAGAPHDELGDYDISLDATDTNTLGRLRVIIKEADVLAVWADFMVMPANVWDSLFGADALQVDLTQINGAAQTATLDTIKAETAGIHAKTTNLPSDPADASVIAAATGAILTAVGDLNDISEAEVKEQVVDALNVDTYAEPGQGNPPATATIVEKVGYVYKAWRNKKEQDGSEHRLFNDAGDTVDQESAVSDAAGTATRGKMVTGA